MTAGGNRRKCLFHLVSIPICKRTIYKNNGTALETVIVSHEPSFNVDSFQGQQNLIPTFPIFFLFDYPFLRGETAVTANSSTLDHRSNSSILVAACLKSLVEKKVISVYVTRLFDFCHVAHRREKRSLVSDIALQSQKKYISLPPSIYLCLFLPLSQTHTLCLSVSLSL